METGKYQWKKKEVDQPTSLHLAKELNVSKVISEILVARGIHDFDSEELARKSGITVIFNRCMLAEHRRLEL